MEAIIERCAGIDVGQAIVAVTVLLGPAHQKARKITRTFRTITRELLELREWLLSEGVTHVGMESTGIYWKNHEGVPSPTPDVSGSVWACIWARS